MLCHWFGWFCENHKHLTPSNGAPEIDGHIAILAIITVIFGVLMMKRNAPK
jgi:hypothetical protein